LLREPERSSLATRIRKQKNRPLTSSRKLKRFQIKELLALKTPKKRSKRTPT